MLDSISWVEFLKVLGVVLVCYYGYVFVRFFRFDSKAILNWVKGSRRNVSSTSVMLGSSGRRVEDSSAMERVEELIGAIEREILPFCCTKQELMRKLRGRLSSADIPEIPALRKMLVRQIILVAQVNSIPLSEQDIMDLINES